MVLNGFQLLKLPEDMTDSFRIEIIREGFNPWEVVSFFRGTGLPMTDWKAVLPFSPRTLERKVSNSKKRVKAVRLKGEYAEAILETIEIYKIGQEAFDDRLDRLNEWLATENPYLDRNTPLSLMDTHHGREMVINELNRIEHSVFA